jgi:hypothetical protein
MKKIFYISVVLLAISSCQKEIEFDLPNVEQTLVIEATVESGLPPRVFISRSQGYFDPYSASSLEDIFIKDAEVFLSDGINNFELFPLTFDTNGTELTVYTNFLDPNIFGQFGKNYTLSVYHEGDTLTASAKIPYPVAMDSLWFDPYDAYDDSLGIIKGNFKDPDTVGNCYRWFSKRINSYTYNYDSPFNNVKGTQKDSRYLAPIGSSVDDKLFNGLKFDFVLPRGEDGVLEGPDDEGVEEFLFKRGDTVVVKSTTTNYPVYLYVRAMENAAVSSGSPFSSSGNLPYNIDGDGIGIFYGYGSTYDTLICE